MNFRRIASLGCLILALAIVSCGGGQVPVKGKVLFKGEPVTVGNLAFTSEDGAKTFVAEIESDGSFVIPGGVPVGVYLVDYERHPAETPDDEGWEQAKKFVRCAVPEDFQAKVGSEDNNFTIELTIESPDAEMFEGDV